MAECCDDTNDLMAYLYLSQQSPDAITEADKASNKELSGRTGGKGE